MAQIELKQVEKLFGEKYAVKPMDLTINNGEFVCLLGPSGCGKTTTLRMISGLETASGGTIVFVAYRRLLINNYCKDMARHVLTNGCLKSAVLW